MATIGVVGAGISGLACAQGLAKEGHRVVVFEKSHALGGRCASRKWEGHCVDYGASFFTLTDEGVRGEILGQGGWEMLQAPVVDGKGREILAKGTGRYYLKKGNQGLGDYLASGLEIRQEDIREVAPIGSGWAVGGELVDAVVSCAPLPQTEAFYRLKLDGAEYFPCLVCFFEYEGLWAGVSRTRFAVSEPSWDLAWSACENHKEGRIAGDRTVMVVHASEVFSRKHLAVEPARAATWLRRDLEVMWGLSECRLLKVGGHAWRFARSRLPLDVARFLPPGLFVTGDSQCESRIESVWKAGLEAARRVGNYLEVRAKE